MFGQSTISLATLLVLSSEVLAATHKVVVGGPGLLTYVPSSVDAVVGDIVEFDILARNHTVTQGSFDTPCSASAGGVTSGFRPNLDNVVGKQIFTYTVADEEPKWFFCDQGTHCESGMVFAVNPGNKFAEYLAKATGASAPTPTATPTPSSTPSPTAAPMTHKVVVGGPGLLTYVPSSIEAAIGDIVEFDILARNHTVTQGSFDTPCAAADGGVTSGFRPNLDNVVGKQIFTYTVADASPKWFFCDQGTHCESGMVFAVNPGNKFAEYLAKATGGASAPTPTATPTPSSTPSPTAAPVTHKVVVGGPGMLTYVPSSIEAAVGDIVEFDILARNHTVTQGSFDTPCSASAGGVSSGFRPNVDNVAGKQTFTYTVADASPKWFFCDQGTHCESGMVFAVNPGNKFADYLAKATGAAPPAGNSTVVTPDVVPYTGSASSRAAPWALAGVAGLLAFFL